MFRGTGHYLFSYPFSSAIGMFILTMGNFEDIYADFDTARSPLAVKVRANKYLVYYFNLLNYIFSVKYLDIKHTFQIIIIMIRLQCFSTSYYRKETLIRKQILYNNFKPYLHLSLT